MIKIEGKILLLHLILLVLVFFIKSPLLLVPVFVLVLSYFLLKKNYNIFLIAGVYSLCMNSELVYYVYSILVIILVFTINKNYTLMSFKKAKNKFKIFIIFLVIMYNVQLFYNYSLLSLPLFIITFLSPIAIFFLIGKLPKDQISIAYIINNILMIAVAQLLIAFVFQAIPTGIGAILGRPTYGDRLQGTTGSSTNLSILLTCSILPFVLGIRSANYKRKEKLLIIIISIAFIAMIFLNDSKTYLYAVVLAFIILVFLNKFFMNARRATPILASLVIITSLLFSMRIIDNTLNKIERDYRDYISGSYSAKTQYYLYSFSFDVRPFYEYIFGTGPGTNGSRASNALAYDVMYKKENTVTLPSFIPPSSSDFTKKYLSGLFTEDYAENSGNRSATLGNPFNSICALFVEFGVVGFILFSMFLFSLVKTSLVQSDSGLSTAVFFIFLANLIIAFLIQTFETPMAMHFMYLFFGLNILNNGRNSNNQYLIND
tara:strand:+ start:17870 stop:19333 length:1464 start_codon:yes stop_codon:yes gene_type:complete